MNDDKIKIDLYDQAWPGERINTPEMQIERERARAGIIGVLRAAPAPTAEFTEEVILGAQWQALALAIVDVLDVEQVFTYVNALPKLFTNALNATLTAARIADHKGHDRQPVPLCTRPREEGDGGVLVETEELKRLTERLIALETITVKAHGYFRRYEDDHLAKVSRFEAMRDSATDDALRGNIAADIEAAKAKAETNRAIADEIDKLLNPIPRTLIWWSDSADREQIKRGRMKAKIPEYMRADYEASTGAPGIGRIWVSQAAAPDPWEVDCAAPFEREEGEALRIVESKAWGIAFHRGDLDLVHLLPGFVTDTDLNLVKR